MLIHVRYDGQSVDLEASQLDVGEASSDNDVRLAVAGYFDVPADKLRSYHVDRSISGDITLRPQATFGC